MPRVEQPQTEAEWQAQYDADTLAQAEQIKEDPVRLTKAQEAARKKVEREKEDLKAMKKVAGPEKKTVASKGKVKGKAVINGQKKPSGTYNVFKRI